MADPVAPFLWGPGGARLTPEEVAAQRKYGQGLLANGVDYSPIQSPWQGAARVAQALLGGWETGQADYASKQNAAESADVIAKSMPMGSAAPAAAPVLAPAGATPAPAAAPASLPTGDTAAAIRAGLIQRGLPEHVADGFLMNFKDESSLNPNLNEAAPIVPGSRGGYGLAQWTGPRRVGLERFAAEKGVPVSDINLQLDYLSNELKGPEAAAAKSILATATPGDAAAAIATNFLRPAPEHLARRVAAYTAGGDGATLPTAAAPAQGYAIPGQAAAPAARPAINPEIIKNLSNPYLNETAKKVVMGLFQSQLEAQQKAADPLRQLQIQQAQGQLAAQPLELQGKELANEKARRELLGEGATALSPEERASFGIPKDQPAYKTRTGEIKFGPAGTKITNNVGDAENSFAKEAGKVTANRFNELVADGQKSKQMMSDMNTLLDLGKGIGTGKGAQLKAVLGPYANAAGINVEGLSDIQAYEAIVNRVAPTLRVAGSGAQSDYELKNFLKSIPSLGNTQEGNELATAVMTGLTQNKVQAAEIASRALAGEISRADAERQLRDLPDPMQPYKDYKQRKANVDELIKKYGGGK